MYIYIDPSYEQLPFSNQFKVSETPVKNHRKRARGGKKGELLPSRAKHL